MGLKDGLDVALSAGIDFMMFFRDFWSLLPLVIRALICVSFGLVVMLGLMKMCF